MFGAMPAGRPKKYSRELQKRADEYLENYEALGQPIPSIERLALHLGIARDTVYAWDRDPDKERFSDTLGRLRDIQKAVTLEKGLLGEFNATIAKLTLSANHGMHERQEREHSGSIDVSGMSDQELLERARELTG